MVPMRRICGLLEEMYGRPKCNPVQGPLDELILTILSQNTSAGNYTKAFAGLKAGFKTWEHVRKADVSQIEDAIRPGGLAAIKAGRIKRLLNDIREQRGELSLDFLSEMGDREARSHLMQFGGVGIKTASCVLMFSLCRPVLPVDTHVYRISSRLGLIGPSVSVEESHEVLQAMLQPEDVYSFHIDMVTHGRRVCKARNPACDACTLLEVCPNGQRRLATGVS